VKAKTPSRGWGCISAGPSAGRGLRSYRLASFRWTLFREATTSISPLALVEAVRLEFQGRADRDSVKDRFSAAFTRVALPKSAAATKTIGSIKSLEGFGRERFYSAVSGRSDPVARMAAARLAAA
jgi:hypothetical protein